jgi:hypothetical protein
MTVSGRAEGAEPDSTSQFPHSRLMTLLYFSPQTPALDAYNAAITASAGKGTKIDLVLSIVRVGFFHGDWEVVSEGVERAQKCVALLFSPFFSPKAR